MQVILRSDVDKLGLRGDVVDVARGYARNFLLPRGLAELASPAKVAELEKRDAQKARHEAKSVDQARELAERLAGIELRFDVKAGPTGSLFGSVTATNVVDELWEQHKIRIDRRKLGMDPIRRLGRYTLPVELFTDVSGEVRVAVAPEGGSLEEWEAAEEVRLAAEAEAAAAAAAAAPPEPEPMPARAPALAALEPEAAEADADEPLASADGDDVADEPGAGDEPEAGDQPAA
jgi:large subunit ribosomal protein L9